MKIKKRKLLFILLTTVSIVSIGINAYAHSGRTDSKGGHKDNKNKSGLGSYHYHCGGHPAHLHPNGVCPYSSTKKTTSNSSSSKKSTTKTTTKSTTISATKIAINETIQSMKVGENKTLTATISPNNVTNKNITWKSSNENIATVSSDGKVIAKQSGNVDITASTSNGKTDTVKINIQEVPKIEETKKETTNTLNMVPVSNSEKINNKTTNTINNEDSSNAVGTVLALGILGGGSYLGYKKYTKGKIQK